jgi:hypothetical protein
MTIGPTAPQRITALACLALITATPPNFAQGLDSEQAIDTIIGSEVEEQQSSAGEEARKVVAAIEKTQDAIATVRKISNVGKLEIVYLPDAAQGSAPPAIREAIARHEAEIDELRQEIEGNAMLFHAIDSRSLLIRDVLAVDVAANDAVVIYAAAQKPD